MSDEENSDIIHLLAGQRKEGDFVYEDVRAQALGDGCYRLLNSPVFVKGAVKGDVVAELSILVGAQQWFQLFDPVAEFPAINDESLCSCAELDQQ